MWGWFSTGGLKSRRTWFIVHRRSEVLEHDSNSAQLP